MMMLLLEGLRVTQFLGSHHTHCKCRKFNNTSWWPMLCLLRWFWTYDRYYQKNIFWISDEVYITSGWIKNEHIQSKTCIVTRKWNGIGYRRKRWTHFSGFTDFRVVTRNKQLIFKIIWITYKHLVQLGNWTRNLARESQTLPPRHWDNLEQKKTKNC